MISRDSEAADRDYKRRITLAIAIAIAIHEIAFGLGGFMKIPETPEPPPPVSSVVLEIRQRTPEPSATPKPTPAPTPPPRATPAVHREVAAPRATVVAVVKKTGQNKGGQKLEVHLPKTVNHKESVPVWWSAPHAAKTVANAGTGHTAGAGSGAGTGTGTGNAPGTGAGTGGAGTGAVSADTPCGGPIFHGLRAKYNRSDKSFDEDVRVELRLANGETLFGDFHYPWHYASEQDNPFSPNWKGGPNDPIPAQLPPPGFDISREPLAVQLTLKYTLPNGTTRFIPCPS
ncbi:MAG: hypothetical protein JO359_10240 [Candidatus Eremiobacteraeota bacterium]|nr:hypothetical protein [Candidatus Eremiobacteraeota bacterium]